MERNKMPLYANVEAKMLGRTKKRVIFVFSFFVIFFFMILVKAFYIQVFNNEKLIQYSQSQIFRQYKIYPNRGQIFDRNGNPLAINIQTYSIFAIPKNMNEGTEDLKKLAKIIGDLPVNKLKKKLHKRNRYTWIARKVSLTKEQVEKVKEIKGIYIEAVPKRFYPNHELLGQTLGFVGLDNIGLSGMEYIFDEELRGEALIVKYLKDAKGRPIKFETEKKKKTAKDLQLTIEKDLQAVAEKALKEGVDFFKAEKGGIGVIDASSGEILAIANYPTFDPNEVKGTNPTRRKLSFVIDPFEPGSIMKTFTIAAALEYKIARPNTSYYCERGALRIGDHIINEAEAEKKHEWLTVSDILKYSSNIGTTKIAFDLTFPKLKKTLDDFNFGQKTGVEIPGESRGIFTDGKNVGPLRLSNISFGQGIATTGIQMLAAYGAVANGGIYYRPTIVKKKGIKKGLRVISEQTAKELSAMLYQAVETGTGENAKIPYFKIAGKTSTAQRPNSKGGYEGYVPGFVGFPLNVDKRFVIYVYVDGPQGRNYYGNAVAAPIFKKVAQYLLYKNKDFKQIELTNAPNEDKKMDLVEVKHSSTRIHGENEVPNFIGLDKVSSGQLANKLNIKIDGRGIGVVTSQIPRPKTPLEKNTVVELIFSPPTYE